MPSGPAEPPATARLEMSDPALAGLFDSFVETFERSQAVVGDPGDRWVEVAGHRIRLRFAGSPCEPPIESALLHLETESGAADLTIHIWDEVSTGVARPGLPFQWSDRLDREAVPGYNTPRFHTAINPDHGLLQMLDRDRGLAIYSLRDAADPPWEQRGSPLLKLMNKWLRRQGLQMLHAAAVGNDRGAVAIAGPSGSGKSTTVAACLGTELRYLSDDYCVLGNEDRPRLHSIYSSGKIHIADRRRFPNLEPVMESDGKLLFYHQRQFPDALVRSLPLRAVLVPEINGTPHTSISAISRMEAFRALAPSTILQLQGTGAEAAGHIADVIRRVPCKRLSTGTDMARIPRVIASLLEDLDGEPGR